MSSNYSKENNHEMQCRSWRSRTKNYCRFGTNGDGLYGHYWGLGLDWDHSFDDRND
jgi:hypothetical protein